MLHSQGAVIPGMARVRATLASRGRREASTAQARTRQDTCALHPSWSLARATRAAHQRGIWRGRLCEVLKELQDWRRGFADGQGQFLCIALHWRYHPSKQGQRELERVYAAVHVPVCVAECGLDRHLHKQQALSTPLSGLA